MRKRDAGPRAINIPFTIPFMFILIGFAMGVWYQSHYPTGVLASRYVPKSVDGVEPLIQTASQPVTVASAVTVAAPRAATVVPLVDANAVSDTVIEDPQHADDVAVSDAPSASSTTTRRHSNKVFAGVVGPDPALGAVLATTGPGKDQPCVNCILVGVTICCKSWKRTETLLKQLLASDDNMHVVVFDDMSEDDSKARAEALGLTVIQPPDLKNVGLTEMMNVMWRYFYARPELQSMFVVNNDIEVSPYKTFSKLNNCLQGIEVRPACHAAGLGRSMELLLPCHPCVL